MVIKMLKKTIAVILCAGLALFAAACADTSYSMKIGDRKIAPGVFILCQMDAIIEANALFIETYPGVDPTVKGFKYEDYELEGVKFTDWVNDRALEITAELLAIEKMFGERGLTLPPEEESAITGGIEQSWDEDAGQTDANYAGKTLGELFKSRGIGKESLKFYEITRAKSNMVLQSVYGEGGTNPVPDAEWQAVWTRDYARCRIIYVDILDEFENAVSEEELEELAAKGEELAAMLEAGESFKSVEDAYYDYLAEKAASEEDEDEDDEDEDEDDTYEEDEDEDEDEEEDEHYGEYILDIGQFSEEDELWDVVEHIFSMGINKPELYKTENMYYVIERLDILERSDLYERYRESIVYTLKNDEFMETVNAEAKEMLASSIEVNQAAVKRYNPKKLA
ncbi:MAG: hypothetical protein LBI38_03585 [Oscillospiraceae bacterium]|jgi:hypothetical protein|nr:hypothetical protein [Oscillospiraceae bacterium]